MPGENNAARDRDYIYGIDLVRFVSAVGVAFYHLIPMISGFPYRIDFGWVGVEVFFVISGLVIANSAQNASARQFAVGRFLRLYPAAWCATLVNFPLFYLAFGIQSRAFLALISSITLLHAPFLATAYWTLPVELSFYFLVFLVIRIHAFKYMQWLAVILILCDVPYMFALVLSSGRVIHWAWGDFGGGAKNMLLLRHGIYFALGILVWHLKEKRISKIGIIAAGVAVVFGIMEIYCRAVELMPEVGSAVHTPQGLWDRLALSPEISFCGGLVAILLSIKYNRLFQLSARTRSVVRQLGLMTYPFYLLHQRVGGFVISQLNKTGLAPVPCLLAALICIAAIAFLVAAYCEPTLRNSLKHRVRLLKVSPKELAPQIH